MALLQDEGASPDPHPPSRQAPKRVFHLAGRVARVFSMGVCLWGLQACTGQGGDPPPPPDPFPVVYPRVIDTVYALDYVADIQAQRNIEVRSRVSGFVEQIHVDEGEHVREGQLLFSIAPQQYTVDLQSAQAALLSAQADFRLAQVELSNNRLLVEKNIIGPTELTMAQAKAEAAKGRVEVQQAAVSLARLNLELTRIRAPFDGVINRIPNKRGSLISEGTLMTTLSDDGVVYAYFNVTEGDYLAQDRNRNGGEALPALLVLANGEVHPMTGKVETVENEIDRQTGTLTFRASFANPSGRLKHGSSGKVRIKRALTDVLLIPQKAVVEIQDKYFVYHVGQGDTLHLQAVRPTQRMGTWYVLAPTSLKPTEPILYEGLNKVRPGRAITPVVETLGPSKVALPARRPRPTSPKSPNATGETPVT